MFRVLLAAGVVLRILIPGLTGPTAPATTGQGYWLGTDSSGVAVAGPGPYREPRLGGAYGGYFGMIGDWALWQGCGHYRLAWSAADAAAASVDLRRYGRGVGAEGYWFMGGPGVDPRYDGTVGEAAAWGAAQARRALLDLAGRHLPGGVLWMDVELPGSTVFDPVPDNGWNVVYSSTCSRRAVGQVPATLDRAELDGFAGYVRAHTSVGVGVYSSPLVWPAIFGAGPQATVHHLLEWTYTDGTASLDRRPEAWCLDGTATCARFFGGMSPTSADAAVWQWSGGGGITNGVGDFDQIDAGRLP